MTTKALVWWVALLTCLLFGTPAISADPQIKRHGIDSFELDTEYIDSWRIQDEDFATRKDLSPSDQVASEYIDSWRIKNYRKNIPSFADSFDVEMAKGLFTDKCSDCHSTNRSLQKHDSHQAWVQTVTRMQQKDPGWFSNEEAKLIITYLYQTQGVE